MPNNLANDVKMATYYLEKKGFDDALSEEYLPFLITDPVIAEAIAARAAAETIIRTRIAELE